MKPTLLPEPKRLRQRQGAFALPRTVEIGICCHRLHGCARVLQSFIGRSSIHVTVATVDDTVTLALDRTLENAEAYRLAIGARGIRIDGATPAAVAHGVQTLRQLVAQADGGRLPRLRIEDWPDLAERGVYYDVCRGRVPKLDRLKQLADHLARYKVNQLQLYIEHTFVFRAHPRIGTGASPLSAEDVLELDEYCAARGIELLPSLACFGHLATVLKHKAYRHLAEDRGVGRYDAPADELPARIPQRGWTLSPAVPEIYDFLDSLFAEFLPLFRSTRFNICCDETWDLGLGQSYQMCREQGKGTVYLNHIKKVRELSLKYGKTICFWGDIIRHYPELISEIPKDVTVLDWGYAHNHPFDRIRDFKQAGLPFYACSGTSSWVSLFPRLPEAMANIHGFAAAAVKHGAQGLLNTDWGDGGHYNFMEYSWHGYLFGAEQGWNVKADRKTFTARFAQVFLGCDDPALVDAITALGEVSHLGGPCYQSVWQTILFAAPDDPVFHYHDPVDLSIADGQRIRIERQRLDAACARAHRRRLQAVRKTLAACARRRGVDPLGVLRYWVFAVDTIACAAHKLAVLGPGGRDTPDARRELKKELRALAKRFERLWLQRNRRSEIRITLARYRAAIEAL